MGILAVAREWFECALTQSRDRTDRRAIGERLCEIAEMSDYHEYHELHGSPSLPTARADDDAPPLPDLQPAAD